MPAIVISEFMDEAAIHDGLAGYDVTYDPSLVDRRDDLSAALKDARALIVRNRTQVDAALLDAAPKLAAIGRLGVGLDNIDVAACAARKIKVFPATGANDVSVAEYVIAAILILQRRAFMATGEVIAGSWPRNRLIGREISGMQLGLVGYGGIGRETARRAAAMGMRIAAYDPQLNADNPAWTPPWGAVEPLPFDQLLAISDVISLHVPLIDETRSLMNGNAIARMQSGAILINTARGGIVDEQALASALRSGHLGGAALDVFAEEPLPAERGAIFANCANLVLTTHIAGVTQESNIRVSRLIADKVRQHLESNP